MKDHLSNQQTRQGLLLRDLRMPDFRDYAADVPAPGAPGIGDTRVLGPFLRDVTKLNSEKRNFRIFGPDETISNRLEAVFQVTHRQWNAATAPNDEYLAPTGRVMEMLSEHQCEGWLEGYLLTGRHGLFNCYETFIHIVDSMFNQHAKWLKVTAELPWRRKISSLNYLLSSHVWRQDHNGFTHQDPGFIDHVVNKKAGIVRVYLPPDGNCLLSVMDHCLRSRHYVNVVVSGKHPAPQWCSKRFRSFRSFPKTLGSGRAPAGRKAANSEGRAIRNCRGYLVKKLTSTLNVETLAAKGEPMGAIPYCSRERTWLPEGPGR